MAMPARRQGFPARVRLYVAAVTVLAVASLPLARFAAGVSGGAVAVFEAVTLAALIAGAQRYPVHIGPKRKVNVGTAPEVAAVLLLPGPLAVLTLAVGTAAGEAHFSAPALQRLFNVAVAVLRAAAGTSIYAGLLRLEPADLAEPVAALTVAVVMYAITIVLVRGIVAVQTRTNPLRSARAPTRDVLVAEAALSLTGIMAALASAERAWAMPLLVAPAVIAHRAVRDSVALQAQTQRVQEALSEARAALAVREEFLSVASHELRTPLTALKGYLDLARRRLRRSAAPHEVDSYVAQADTQIDRLTGLVYELLDVSRIVGGWVAVEREPVDIAALVGRVVEMESVAEPPRRIEVEVPDSHPIVMADPGRLEQVLINLLENARKYSPAHKPIHVSIGAGGDATTIAVRDEGVGIPAAEQEQIFHRFHRAGNVDKGVTGLGLGLYIANELVGAHGGRLTVESAPGAGSTFTVTLPRNHAPSAQPEEADGEP
jgi:signal transduction histidine kinase